MSVYISDNTTFKWHHEGTHYCLHIQSDNDPLNPRKDFDNVGTMACWHRQYSLGDDVKESSPEFFWNQLVGDHIPEEAQRKIILSGELSYQIREIEGKYYIYLDDKEEYGPYDTVDEAFSDYYCDLIPIKDCMKMLEPCLVWLPLWLYDHSGITMSCGNWNPYNDSWDSCCVGFIFMTKEASFKELAATEESWRDKAIAVMEAEVETYDQYLRGEVYSYTLYEESANGEWTEIDSCWGFFGDDLLENGILDYCPSLSEAIKSGDYEKGTAELHTTSWYTF